MKEREYPSLFLLESGAGHRSVEARDHGAAGGSRVPAAATGRRSGDRRRGEEFEGGGGEGFGAVEEGEGNVAAVVFW